MTKFYPLTIRDLRRETADCVSVAFEIPADLADKFRFKQGQYLTLKTEIGGEETRRSYSICVSPAENELRVAVKKVAGGLFSTFANEQLNVGDQLEVMPPQGRFFTEMNPENENLYVGFAAGSGITPVISILKTVLSEEPCSRFLLFFGNRSFDSILFREELERLKNLHPSRLAVHHILSGEKLGSPLFQGRLSGEKCRQFARPFFRPEEVDAFFICGPDDLTFDLKNTLETLGVPPKRILFELFGTKNAGQAATKSRRQTTDSQSQIPDSQSQTPSFQSQIVVIQDGTQFMFSLSSAGESILDAATRAGADLPFSCRGGVCCTCKGRVLDGEVEMTVNYALEPEEVEAGYILTCQSHPRSPRVMVTFDA